MKSVRKRLTYANVMSSLAVFLVVAGGTAFAASQLGKESVGTKQLKKEAVSLAKINAAAKKALKGATGPAGLSGPKGDKGEKGDTGATGSVSSPSSLFRTTTYLFQKVEATTGSLATLSFTPSETGEALVRARGYCNISPDATGSNEIDLFLGRTALEAAAQPFTNQGIIRLTKETSNGPQAYGYTAERTLPVTAGATETVGLFGVGSGAGTQKDCSGTLTIMAVF